MNMKKNLKSNKQQNIPKYIYLVRHGEVEPGHEKRYIGVTDPDLSECGEEQARLLFNDTPLKSFYFLSSPLLRTRRTAALALQEVDDKNIEIDQDLREIDFGVWEDFTFDEIKNKYPEEVTKWAEYNLDFVFPGGESIAHFLMRIKRVGTRISSLPETNIAVFTHGGVIRSLICHFLGIEPEGFLSFDIKPASITTIKIIDGYGVLTGLDNSISMMGK
jgi:broad specificity phosphatase PhoE